MKKLTKKQKTMISVVGVAVIVFGGTYAYGQSQSNKKRAEAKQELTVSTNKLAELDKQIVALLDSKDSNYLAKDVKEEQITKLKKQVETETTLKDTENLPKADYDTFKKQSNAVQQDIQKVETAYKTQTTVNGLFKRTDKEVAMNGSDVKKDLTIADDLKKETVEQAKKEVYKDKSTVPYDKTVNELLTNAENQINQLEKAKSEVAKVYKDGKVISTDTKAYDTAKAETDKVKNEKAKKGLSDQLAKVKADIDKKAKEEADKKNQSSEAKKTSQADGAKQDNATTDTPTADGTATANAENNATTDNGYTANGGATDNGNAGSNGGGYTPPTGNGGGSTGGGSTNTPSGNGGGGSAPSTTYDPMTPIGSGGLYGSEGAAHSAGMNAALAIQVQTGVSKSVQIWEVKYTDGRSAGWTYELV